jgi:hypothetical protein
VVLAQDAAAPGQGVFAQLPGRLPAADPQQADGQVVGRGQGIGMVLAQDAAAAGQGVFAQLPGRLMLAAVTNAGGQVAGGDQSAGVPADRTQADGQAIGGGQGVGVVLAQDAAAAGQRVFV